MKNIKDYEPTDSSVYGYVHFDVDCLVDLDEDKSVEYLIHEFEGHTKGMIKKDEAYNFWKHNLSIQGLSLNKEQLQRAYDVAFGYGCEFEWN